MSTTNELRDELYLTGARVVKRALTSEERSDLVDAYNAQEGDQYQRCRVAISTVLGVDIGPARLFEKSASVDRVMLAISNLRAVAAASAGSKK